MEWWLGTMNRLRLRVGFGLRGRDQDYVGEVYGEGRGGRVLGFEFGGVNPKFGGVSLSNYRVRRATLDDIGQLTALWEAMHTRRQSWRGG